MRYIALILVLAAGCATRGELSVVAEHQAEQIEGQAAERSSVRAEIAARW